ncbi:MAG TPA: type III PLP-dependent enzyme [Spirochaetota bacterium]|nr:type III PLP-dependent enzyme [Spirochaetota bacterium]HOL56260.1 type III PLP-dependent enzyme [Spirochaetota bacterium]HPP04394.1 type III PLP-dependent enzyme [Spirochaetota bacterium]
MISERRLYWKDDAWERFLRFSKDIKTPALVIDLRVIRHKFEELKSNFPYAKIYYAVKANPSKEILKMLVDMGSCFDIASVYELDDVLQLGVTGDRISFGNTIKKKKDIEYAYKNGVRLFATDSKADLVNIAEAAPNSKVFVRILMESSESADWPLSRKFGCHPDMAYDLIVEAKELGLIPYGISFHVGSQQRDIGQWDDAIARVKYLFNALEDEEGIKLKLINMGGGLPASYKFPTNSISVYAKEITRYIEEDFGNDMPEIIIEPGRSLVSDAGVIISEVILISRKNNTALNRWVYLDVGKFNGLIETMDECIKYPVFTEKSGKMGDVILAGPTCDSMDVMYEKFKYKLPVNLAIGDRVYWFSTGAYTASYCSVGFNGFPPMKTYFIPEDFK